jgi:hypothetical protein
MSQKVHWFEGHVRSFEQRKGRQHEKLQYTIRNDDFLEGSTWSKCLDWLNGMSSLGWGIKNTWFF